MLIILLKINSFFEKSTQSQKARVYSLVIHFSLTFKVDFKKITSLSDFHAIDT